MGFFRTDCVGGRIIQKKLSPPARFARNAEGAESERGNRAVSNNLFGSCMIEGLNAGNYLSDAREREGTHVV